MGFRSVIASGLRTWGSAVQTLKAPFKAGLTGALDGKKVEQKGNENKADVESTKADVGGKPDAATTPNKALEDFKSEATKSFLGVAVDFLADLQTNTLNWLADKVDDKPKAPSETEQPPKGTPTDQEPPDPPQVP